MKASGPSGSVTIDDLVQRTNIEKASISPDGRYVAYLTLKAMPVPDCYQAEIRVSRSDAKEQSNLVSSSCIRPEEAFDADSGAVLDSAGSFAWSARGALFFTRRVSDMSVVFRYEPSTGWRTAIFRTRGWVELRKDRDGVHLSVHRMAALKIRAGHEAWDLAVQVEDGTKFYKPFTYPSFLERTQVEEWVLPDGSRFVHRVRNSGENKHAVEGMNSRSTILSSPDAEVFEGEVLNGGSEKRRAVVEWVNRDLRDPTKVYRTSRIVLEPGHRLLAPEMMSFYALVGWSDSGRKLFYIRRDAEHSSVVEVNVDGASRELLSDSASFRPLAEHDTEDEDHEAFAILVRSTNIMPDELVKVDLQSGQTDVLYAPNRSFESKRLPTVRLIAIPGTPIYGRLYLPPGRRPGERCPLVFTGYMSGPGFDASVGDELPVLVLPSHGIAVFAMNEYGVNIVSHSGDFEFEINRVARPLYAMEYIRSKLAAEGFIDPGRCGIAGVSYGSEIAMYAYWKSKVFKAVSVATATWGPMDVLLAGTAYGEYLKARGFPSIDEPTDPKWKALSAALNVRRDLPPLLLQSSADEEYFGNIETWMQLKRVQARVTWYSYPGEGHIKRGPANKWWVYRRNLDWFERWLLNKGNVEPSGIEIGK